MTPDPYETPGTNLTEADRRHPVVRALGLAFRLILGLVGVAMMLAGGLCTVLGMGLNDGLPITAIGLISAALGFLLILAVRK